MGGWATCGGGCGMGMGGRGVCVRLLVPCPATAACLGAVARDGARPRDRAPPEQKRVYLAPPVLCLHLCGRVASPVVQAFSWAVVYRTQNYNPTNLLSKPDGVFSSGWRTGINANGALATVQAATNATNGSCAATSATVVGSAAPGWEEPCHARGLGHAYLPDLLCLTARGRPLSPAFPSPCPSPCPSFPMPSSRAQTQIYQPVLLGGVLPAGPGPRAVRGWVQNSTTTVWSAPWSSSGCGANLTGNVSNTSPLSIASTGFNGFIYEILAWKGVELR